MKVRRWYIVEQFRFTYIFVKSYILIIRACGILLYVITFIKIIRHIMLIKTIRHIMLFPQMFPEGIPHIEWTTACLYIAFVKHIRRMFYGEMGLKSINTSKIFITGTYMTFYENHFSTSKRCTDTTYKTCNNSFALLQI